ncbi:hypothetical protein MRX96_002943 [Rhipicephalus microplus]
MKINEEVGHGVLSVREDETSELLKSKLYWCEGEIAFVRMPGQSLVVVVVTFVERKLPRYINYNFECVMARCYKTTIPARYKCDMVGHWVDNCPSRKTARCRQHESNMEDPEDMVSQCSASTFVSRPQTSTRARTLADHERHLTNIENQLQGLMKQLAHIPVIIQQVTQPVTHQVTT